MGARKNRKAKSKKARARAKSEARRDNLDLVRGFTPSPCELEATFYDPDVAASHRYWSCPRYEDCLDVATIANWHNFTCRACPVYRRYYDKWAKRIRSTEWTKTRRNQATADRK